MMKIALLLTLLDLHIRILFAIVPLFASSSSNITRRCKRHDLPCEPSIG